MTPPLDCKHVFEKLDDYLDRELSPQEMTRVEEHLRDCEHCALDAQFESQVLDSLKERMRRLTIPDSLKQRVLDSLNDA